MLRALGPVVAMLLATAVPATEAQAEEPRTLEAITMWQERSAGGDWDIHYAFVGRGTGAGAELEPWTPDGTATSPLAVHEGDDTDPAVSIGADGTVIAVWSNRSVEGGTGIIHWSQLGPSGWTQPEPVGAAASGEDPAVAVGDGGTALAAWNDPHAPDGPAMVTELRDGAWSEPSILPGSQEASLAELTMLDDGAMVVHAGRNIQGVMRTHASFWDGTQWTPSEPVPLSGEQEAQMPEHASASGGSSGAFSRLGVAPQSGGGAVVVWGSPVLEDWTNHAKGVQGSRFDPSTGTWAPMTWRQGSVDVTEAECESIHSPSVTATGSGDALVAFAGHGGLGYARRIRSAYSNGGAGPRTAADDVRPAIAALSDRVLALSWNNPYPWDRASEIGSVSMSLGTLRPRLGADGPRATWSDMSKLSVREARSPAVASSLGGTTRPLHPVSSGRGIGLTYRGPDGENGFADTGPPASGDPGTETATWAGTESGPVRVSGLSSTVHRSGDRAAVTVAIGEIRIAFTPPIVIRDLVVTASAECGEGPAGATAVGSIHVGAVPLAGLDMRRNTSASGGAAVVRLNRHEQTPNGLTVTGVTVTGPDMDIVVGTATAHVVGCPGTGPPAAIDGGHEH